MGFTATELQEKARSVIEVAAPGAIMQEVIFRDEVTFYLNREAILPVLSALRADAEVSFGMLSDVTAIDYLNLAREPRFDVVYTLYSLETYNRLRLKCPVPEDDCRIDSACGLWSGASFMEREVFDMFGISFDGHPDLRRILMPDNWKGHPLRKDHPLGGSKSFYYRKETQEYAGEPDDLIPRIRIQEGEI